MNNLSPETITVLGYILGVLGFAAKFIWEKYLVPSINANKNSKMVDVINFARVAVVGAEEKVGAGDGNEKLDYATLAITDFAHHFGVKLTDMQVDALVHAALNELRQVQPATFAAAPVEASVPAPQPVAAPTAITDQVLADLEARLNAQIQAQQPPAATIDGPAGQAPQGV